MVCPFEFWLFGEFLDNHFSKNNKVIPVLCERQISKGLKTTEDAGHNEKHLAKRKMASGIVKYFCHMIHRFH